MIDASRFKVFVKFLPKGFMVFWRDRKRGRVENFSGVFEVNAVVQAFPEGWKCIGRIFREDVWEFFDGVEQSIRLLGKLSSGT